MKNKVAPPFRQVEFDIMYGHGISKSGELLDLGVKAGIVEKSGAWFSYDGQRIGQGRENAKQYLEANKDAAAAIEAAIRGNAGLLSAGLTVAEDARRRMNSRSEIGHSPGREWLPGKGVPHGAPSCVWEAASLCSKFERTKY